MLLSTKTQSEKVSSCLHASLNKFARQFVMRALTNPEHDQPTLSFDTSKSPSLFQVQNRKPEHKAVILKLPTDQTRERLIGGKSCQETKYVSYTLANVFANIGKAEISEAELYPSFSLNVCKHVNAHLNAGHELSTLKFKPEFFVSDIEALLQEGVNFKHEEINEVVQDVSKQLSKYYNSLFSLVGKEELEESIYQAETSKQRVSLAPQAIVLILQKLGLLDGMIKELKDGVLVARCLDLICWLILMPELNTGNHDFYNLQYESFSNDQVTSKLYSLVAKGIIELLQRGAIKDSYRNYQGIYRVFERIFNFSTSRVITEGEQLADKADIIAKAKQEELEKLMQEWAEEDAKLPKLTRGAKRILDEAGNPLLPPKFGKGNCSQEEKQRRAKLIADFEERKRQIKAQNKLESLQRQEAARLRAKARAAKKKQVEHEAVSRALAKLEDRYYLGQPYKSTAIQDQFADFSYNLYRPVELKGRRSIYFDGTSLLSNAADNSNSTLGPVSTDKSQIAPVMKLLVGIDGATGIPVCCRPFLGSETDQQIIRKVQDTLAEFTQDNVTLLLDRGFSCVFNYHLLDSLGVNFLMMNQASNEKIRDLLKPMQEQILEHNWKHYSIENECFYIAKKATAFELGICDAEGCLLDSSGKVVQFDSQNLPLDQRINPNKVFTLVAFHDPVRNSQGQIEEIAELKVLLKKIKSGKEKLTKRKVNHRNIKESGGDYEIDWDKVNQLYRENLLNFVITNMDLDDAMEAIALYERRWQIELFFKVLKGTMPNGSVGNHNDETIAVKICICLLATCVKRYVTQCRINILSSKTEYQTGDEKKLKVITTPLQVFQCFRNVTADLWVGNNLSEAEEYENLMSGFSEKEKGYLDLALNVCQIPRLNPRFSVQLRAELNRLNPDDRSKEESY